MSNLRLCTALLFVMAASAFGQEAKPAPATPEAAAPAPCQTGAPVHIGGNVRPPLVIATVDPVYTSEARSARFAGNVQVYLWVDEHGNPSHVRVIRGVGMGLDEKAVEAVRQYKFRPAMLNGCPVKTDLYIEVNFSLGN